MSIIFIIIFRYFPSQGEKVHVFFTDIKLPEELSKIDFVVKKLQYQKDIISDVDSWYSNFEKYYDLNFASKGNFCFNFIPLHFFQNTPYQSSFYRP